MSSNNNDVKKLVGKLVVILASLGPIQKKGRNTHFQYNFISEGQLASEFRGKLAEKKIFLFTSVESITTHVGQAKEGTTVTVQTKHTFFDAESGAEFVVGGAGVGWDSGDKGVYKAITGATKYALMKNFLITDEQDPESGKQKQLEKPAAEKKHSRTTDESGTGKEKAEVKADLKALQVWCDEEGVPPSFVLAELKEKGLSDGSEETLADLKPGVLARVLKSRARLLEVWNKKGEKKPPGKAEKKEVRTNEGDQRRKLRQPAQKDLAPDELLEQEGVDNWRKVEIHFGKQKGMKLGKLSVKQLKFWIENWPVEKVKGKWDDQDLLLDAALCVAHAELANAEGGAE